MYGQERDDSHRYRGGIAIAPLLAVLGIAPLVALGAPVAAFAADTTTGCYTVTGNLVKDCGFENPDVSTAL